MNFKIDLNKEQQALLQDIGFKIEDRNYSSDEIKKCESSIVSHIVSQSANNVPAETLKYNELIDLLVRHEK